jgi:hypothetical protein
MFAIFTITGRVSNTFAETIVNARIEFAFDPPATKKPTTPGSTPLVATAPATKPLDESIIDARGAITELRMARVAAGLLPDATRKLNFSAQQELILRRKLGVEAGSKPLALVTPPPANDVNSWISYVDPAGRFYFHHPQELLPPERFQLSGSADDDSIVIVKNRPDGREMVRIDVFREAMEPDALQDVLAAEWRRSGAEVLPGPSEWLPEAAFPAPLKVFRIESALKLGARGARLHYDAYLVKYSDDINLMVIATSSRDAVDAFRRNVEAMIATFKLGAPNH